MSGYAKTCRAYLCGAYAGPHAAKRLARDAGGISPATAKNWLSGRCAPRGEELVTLLAAHQGLFLALLGLAAARRRGPPRIALRRIGADRRVGERRRAERR
ncbi:MAG TPA: hypothetical protein VNE67_09235, partial [Acetobacteraceae bacterium]|nr:hypothetical protein [Acetobacteraceae bacterium]